MILRIQSILFNNEPESIRRALRGIHRAADLVIAAGFYKTIEVSYGDCSPLPIFSYEEIVELKAEHAGYFKFDIDHFGANLGSAKGHNTLLEKNASNHVLIMNPDVMLAPNALIEMIRPLSTPGVAMVEARQLPIEHPKAYNALTGETGWATTACALIPSFIFEKIGMFDSETFFLYCDDVDFSWRVRLAGYKVIYQPTATVFHDKRLSNDAGWLPSGAEKYYSAEAALLLPYKWSREDITQRILKEFKNNSIEYLAKAAEEFLRRQQFGVLPKQIDSNNRIAEFVGDMYSAHRFGI